MTTNPYKITRTVPRDPASEYVHDPLFRTDRRDNGLTINTGHISGSHVRTVSDDSAENWQFIRDQIVAGKFGYLPGVHQAYVRDALRPASRGQGRARNR
jgi:hypothetical protein